MLPPVFYSKLVLFSYLGQNNEVAVPKLRKGIRKKKITLFDWWKWEVTENLSLL